VLSSELAIQVESEAMLEFALSNEAGKHSNDSRTWSGFILETVCLSLVNLFPPPSPPLSPWLARAYLLNMESSQTAR
jgi:hypothetical protein